MNSFGQNLNATCRIGGSWNIKEDNSLCTFKYRVNINQILLTLAVYNTLLASSNLIKSWKGVHSWLIGHSRKHFPFSPFFYCHDQPKLQLSEWQLWLILVLFLVFTQHLSSPPTHPDKKWHWTIQRLSTTGTYRVSQKKIPLCVCCISPL